MANDKPTTEADDTGNIQMEMVAVAIRRDANIVIHTEVLPVEIPILQFIHREENITVLDDVEVGTVSVDPSAEAEFARLLLKYTNKDEEVIRHVYPRGAADLREFGFKSTGSAAAKPAGAVVQASGKAKKAAAKK